MRLRPLRDHVVGDLEEPGRCIIVTFKGRSTVGRSRGNWEGKGEGRANQSGQWRCGSFLTGRVILVGPLGSGSPRGTVDLAATW